MYTSTQILSLLMLASPVFSAVASPKHANNPGTPSNSDTFLPSVARAVLQPEEQTRPAADAASDYDASGGRARVYTTCSTPYTVALTFDDGPYNYLYNISDQLTNNGAKGSFFVISPFIIRL